MGFLKAADFPMSEVTPIMQEYGLDEANARLSLERRQIYGDPYQNHRGIAQSWAGILQPWWDRIRRGEHLPPHVVALLMVQVKTSRCRLKHHQDNFDDAEVYLAFTSAFQKRWEAEGGEAPLPSGDLPREEK